MRASEERDRRLILPDKSIFYYDSDLASKFDGPALHSTAFDCTTLNIPTLNTSFLLSTAVTNDIQNWSAGTASLLKIRFDPTRLNSNKIN